MKKVKFLFGIHCHQPVGNFDYIFEEAYQKSYLPFIQAMERHPKIKFAAHYSGELYDFFLEKHPEFIDELKKLVKRGQLEIMTAGYYEPILPLIPDADKIGQISMSNEFIKSKIGAAPRGLWLTERIWEPHLPKILSEAGVEYVTVDDHHFLSAGLKKEELFGYYLTEEEGKVLKIFPINKDLRYMIPFKLPEETIKYLNSVASEEGDNAAVIADDGEKFGVWPGTHRWVYEEGYLEKLLTLLEENSSWIEFMTFSQYLDEYPPKGRIYLPAASYPEMMEWAGGFFRNFLVKYPEANNMHKKMLEVSSKLEQLSRGKNIFGGSDHRLRQAQVELYKGQCNCAYWHGVFGGLYLNYLRSAVYEHLIKAETILDRAARGKDDFVELRITDFDKDGRDEIIFSNSQLNLYFSPHYGGSLFELDYKPRPFNLVNTLARRREPYHQKIAEAAAGGGQGGAGAQTIHEIASVKEEGLEKALVYDRHRRICLLDHFLSEETNLDQFRTSNYNELGDFTVGSYQPRPQRKTSELSLSLSRQGEVAGSAVKIEKQISLLAKQSIVPITYEITNLGESEVSLRFGVEFNFSLLSGADLKIIEEKEKTANLSLVDDWLGLGVSLELEKEALLWRFPVETVSQSESGFEKTYQSTAVFPSWRLALAPKGKWWVSMVLKIEGR